MKIDLYEMTYPLYLSYYCQPGSDTQSKLRMLEKKFLTSQYAPTRESEEFIVKEEVVNKA